ncbi:dihydrodipicolinate synthase family protein [Spongiimicrobium sp. 3-5]|uniref:dihydrodipicolinate synthase family protein n=1 Tax=Spongiimicrobium sp. 3-5 TaxID=3332596 RepID=UPI00397FFB3D
MNFKKLISASYTPFKKSDLSLDLEKVETLYNNLLKNGVKGTMICGTTGEGYSLSAKERKILAAEWSSVISDDFDLMIHVGHNSVVDIKELVESAVSLNSAAVVLSPPLFYKPLDIENLIDFLTVCIEGHPETDFYYYHIPSMTGVEFPMIQFLQQLKEKDVNIKGIKYTHEDLDEYSKCLDYQNTSFDMIFGRDELLLNALPLGAKSALGSTYNFMSPIYLKMIDLFENGKFAEAEKIHLEVNKIIDVMVEFGGGVIAGKAMMNLIGLDCGPTRLPLRTLNVQSIENLKSNLEKTKFYEYKNKQLIT